MKDPKDIYLKCDVLENLPAKNRENWLFEMELLKKELPKDAKILQVGSMDATRAIRLLKIRPDLKVTGIEIESPLVELAKKNIKEADLKADFIHGDITNPPDLPKFDYVICLNNTLGYIPEEKKAIEAMKRLGKKIIISAYSERFNDSLAKEYFSTINLEIDHIENNTFIMKDFTKVKRYTRQEVDSWKADITETPIGYFCTIDSER